MKTEETITRIGRTFEVHESLGKRYIKCDRCENQYESVSDAAKCCAEAGEQKQVRKLASNERQAERMRTAKAQGDPRPAPAPAKHGKKSKAKKDRKPAPSVASASVPGPGIAQASLPVKALQEALSAVGAQIRTLTRVQESLAQALELLDGRGV